MPIYITPQKVKMRELEGDRSEQFYGLDVVAAETTAEHVAAINSAADEAEGRVNDTINTVTESMNNLINTTTNDINEAVNTATTNLNAAATNANRQANDLNNRVQAIAAAIVAAEGTATDPSLVLPEVPADAKAAGDAIKATVKVSSTQPQEDYNRLWIHENAETETEIPTYEEFMELKSAVKKTNDAIYNEDALFDGIMRDESDIGWTVGFVSANDGTLRPGSANGSTYMIYSDLILSDEDINLRALDGFAVRYFRYNKDATNSYYSGIGNQTPPYSATLTPDYAYRIQYAVVSGSTKAQAEQAIAAISTHINLTVPVYNAPITADKLEAIGVAFNHQITWDVGYVNPSTGAFVSGGSTGGNYHVVSSLINTDYGFNLLSTRNVRWFYYNKETDTYDNGVGWQTAPIDRDFSADKLWRIQILGDTTTSGAQDIINHIDDYVTIIKAKESDAGWIKFLPIEDVYIGDVQQRIYFNELARYEEKVGYFKVDVSGATYPEVTYTDRYIEFNATGAKTITLTINYYYHDMISASKTLIVHTKIAALPNKKIMFLGDSYTKNGGMVKWFKDHNENITLYGTCQTTLGDVTYQHEGRGGWTAGNYLSSATKSGVTNPFYNPNKQTFDFEYYMTSHDEYNGDSGHPEYNDVDIVSILLGRNSGFPISNMDALDTIVASIKSYNSNIMVVLMCDNNLAIDNSGAGAYLQNVHTANKQSHIYNAAFYNRYKNDPNVVMCFANLNLDNVYDFETAQVDSSITNNVKVTRYIDNVHPWNIPGLGKFGIALNGLLRNILN